MHMRIRQAQMRCCNALIAAIERENRDGELTSPGLLSDACQREERPTVSGATAASWIVYCQ